MRHTYYEVHMTSSVDSVMFVNRGTEMVSFEFGKEIEKDAFSSCHEREMKKKF